MRQAFLVASLSAAAVGGVIYSLLGAFVASRSQARRRVESLTGGNRNGPSRVTGGDTALEKRRKVIAETLANAEARGKRKLSLEDRIQQGGLEISRETFVFWCIGCCIFLSVIVFLLSRNLLMTLGLAIVILFGAPNWMLIFLRKRRIAKFIAGFPDALDIIVRGVRAGLTVADCFKMIASESPEPVRTEFRLITDGQIFGLSPADSAARMAQRVPVSETAFFATVIEVQQKSGGNLSEAMSNLSSILRARRMLREKVQALAAEAKVSAWIIGSLPVVVCGAFYFLRPDVIGLLFSTFVGNVILGVSLVWMAIGVIVMRSMINFDI